MSSVFKSSFCYFLILCISLTAHAQKFKLLGQVNDSLALENAKLLTELITLKNVDSSKTAVFKDTVYHQQYTLVSAKVIKNSILLKIGIKYRFPN